MFLTLDASIFDQSQSADILQSVPFALGVVIFVCYLQWHWNRRHMYKAASKFQGPNWIPIIGNAIEIDRLAKDYFGYSPKMFKKYGSPLRAWMGHRLVVALTTVEDAEALLNSPASADKSSLLQFFSPLFGKGLLISPGHMWKSHRKIMQPTFNPNILNGFMDIFAENAQVLVECLKQDVGKDCDIFDRFFRFTCDTVCESAMGIKTDTQTTKNQYGVKLQQFSDIMYKRMYKVWLHPEILFKMTPYYNDAIRLAKEIRGFSEDIIKLRREEYLQRKRDEVEGTLITEDLSKKKITFLDMMIEISENDKELNFSNERIGDETATFIAAGSDTTANTDSFIVTSLAINPEVQEKVYKEIMEILGPDRSPQKKDLQEMYYLERVIKETMRFFPVFPQLARECYQDVEISDNRTIPGGSTALVMVHLMHFDPKYWTEPNKFDPDRFLPEVSATRHPFAYLPFAAGARNCIGQKFAMMSMKIAIATLVRRFVFYTDYESMEDVKLKFEVVTKPKYGFKIRLEERH